MWRWLTIWLLINTALTIRAQELFIISEPASSVPYKSLIVRGYTQWYDEMGAIRGMGAMSFYYGLTPRLSVNLTIAGSNHHDKNLPKDIINHRHVGNQSIYFSNQSARDVPYPFMVKGINAAFKYRFLSIDDHREHFRAAVTGMYSNARSAHDEAEANLIDDNAGVGFGVIATYLHQRMAVSLNYQYMVPKPFEQTRDGETLRLEYGHTQLFILALGYLLSPKEYESYLQTNTNLYLELVGKKYQQVDIYKDGEAIEIKSPSHVASHWIEFQPGIQKVYNSTTILEFSIGFPLINASFSHATPTYYLSLRRYLYF